MSGVQLVLVFSRIDSSRNLEVYITVGHVVDRSLTGEQTLWRYVGLECCMSLGDSL